MSEADDLGPTKLGQLLQAQLKSVNLDQYESKMDLASLFGSDSYPTSRLRGMDDYEDADVRISIDRELLTNTWRVRITNGARHLTKSFDSERDAQYWMKSGTWREEWDRQKDQACTITWSPIRKLWSVSVQNQTFQYHTLDEAMATVDAFVRQIAPARTQSKIEEPDKTNYGQW